MSYDPFSIVIADENDAFLREKPKKLKFNVKNETKRLSIAWRQKGGDGSLNYEQPSFISVRRAWYEFGEKNKGYIILPPQTHPDYAKFRSLLGSGRCGSQAKIKTSVSTLVVVWPIDAKGQVVKDGVKDGLWMVIPWITNTQTYTLIKNAMSDEAWGERDLKVTCTNPTFQGVQVTSQKGCVLKSVESNLPETFQAIQLEVEDALDRLKQSLGRVIPYDVFERMSHGMTLEQAQIQTSAQADMDGVAEDLDEFLG